LIGHKQLLNFDAWSTPDTGGWILFGVMALLAGVYFLELRRKRPAKPITA
jgi:copper chaperone NosL